MIAGTIIDLGDGVHLIAPAVSSLPPSSWFRWCRLADDRHLARDLIEVGWVDGDDEVAPERVRLTTFELLEHRWDLVHVRGDEGALSSREALTEEVLVDLSADLRGAARSRLSGDDLSRRIAVERARRISAVGVLHPPVPGVPVPTGGRR